MRRRSAGTFRFTSSLWALKTSTAKSLSSKRPSKVPFQISLLIIFMASGDTSTLPPTSSPRPAAWADAWMLLRQLAYHSSGSRTLSRIFASGKVSEICSQNVHAGQSTVDSHPSKTSVQSTGSPSTAACQAGSSSGCLATSIMWNEGPKPSCSSAPFSDIVPVRPKPAPITFISSSSPAQQHQSDGHARADRDQQAELIRARAAHPLGRPEHEEARRGARVAVLRQHRGARGHLLVRQAEPALSALQDPAAARVEEPVVDGARVEPLRLEELVHQHGQSRLP